MNSYNSVANGGKLDDCHSSIYALAELKQLRWRTYFGSLSLPTSPSDDPILMAFSKCLAQDVLAVWRKKPNQKRGFSMSSHLSHFHDDDMNSDVKKELWIFWWGNENDSCVEDIGKTSGLTLESECSWEDPNQGLSYDCRTLLFKAIHNLIEKCMLSKDYVRVGKWFIRPHKKEDDDDEKCSKLSVSFMFFLRGENTVCTTVDIAEHQPLERISGHVAGTASKTVILSPYGLKASLTGVVHKSPHQQVVKTVIDEWNGFYPIKIPQEGLNHDDQDNNAEQSVPPVVEVFLSGVRMNYPTAYVLVPYEKLSPVKDSDRGGWNSDKRNTGLENGSHHGDFPSIGSFQDSVGVYSNETASSPTSDSHKGLNGMKVESTSSIVKKLISRVVSASQMTPEAEVNGVLPHSESHPSPVDGSSHWPKLNCQFKKVRQKMNYLPMSDDDLNLPSRMKYDDGRRKGDKLKQFAAVPFHRSSSETNQTQNSQIIPSNFHSSETNSMIMMYPPQQTCFVNFSQFGMVQEEMQKPMDAPTSVEPMFQIFPNGNEAAPIGDNFHNSSAQVDHNSFNYNSGISEQAIGNASVGEITERVSIWKKIKLPKDQSKQHKLQQQRPERPTLQQEPLESDLSTTSNTLRLARKGKSSIQNIQKEHSWILDSKKRKVEDQSMNPDALDNSISLAPNVFSGDMNHVISQHVHVGAATVSLAGMAVLSDPYEFEDDERDSFSAPTFVLPSNENSSMDMLSQKKPIIANLLKQTSQDHTFQRGLSAVFDDPMGMDKPGSSSLMEQRDLKVSELDLNNIFNDDDDDDNEIGVTNMLSGVQVKLENPSLFPSPITNSFIQSNTKNETGKFGTGGQNMLTHGPVAGSYTGNEISVETLGSLAGNMPGTAHGYGRVFEDATKERNEVFSKHPLSKQPLTDKYSPLTFKSLTKTKEKSLPRYTPSWQMQVETYINTQNVMPQMDTSEDMNFLHTTDAPTPVSHSYSVSTPASVPQQSPAQQQMPRTPRTPRTPRAGSSPATSTPNPAAYSRFPAHTPLTSVSSSVAPSEIGNCRASSIYVNLMLSDSVFNLFRDISFDQCPMCVCNDNRPIHSRDVDLGYLPSMADNLSDSLNQCSCGFSAIRNRILSVGAGLFLEDELDIIGKNLETDVIKSREAARRPSNGTTEVVVNFAMKQAPNPFLKVHSDSPFSKKCQVYNIAAQQDIMEACVEAINGGITVLETGSQPKIQVNNCKNIIHPWIDSRMMKNTSSSDMFQLMQNLRPTLQDAIQNPAKERPYQFIQHVSGPLTWREFCKDNTVALEPLPIPMLLVGQNYDWLTVSPFALDYWEKLCLVPYSGFTNVSYLTICPDADHIFNATKLFFTELSQLYDLCKLGFHKPFIRNMPDSGVISVSKSIINNVDVNDSTKSQNDLNNSQSTSSNTDSKKSVDAYVAACRDILYPLFSINLPSDSSGDMQGSQTGVGSMPNSLGKSGLNRPPTPLPPKLKSGKDYLAQFTSKQATTDNATLVLYFIDPFIEENCSAFSIAIWKCYTEIVKSLPQSRQNSVVIQLVPLEDILQYAGSTHKSSVVAARSLAFSTYFQCRHRLANPTSVRTMTAFGPASIKSDLLSENRLKLALPALHSPPYVLAGSRNTQKDALILEKRAKECNILYLTYCLSHDQKWLIASATDQDGEVLETFCVNIDVPPRRVSLKKKHRISVKSEAIQKLWKLCLSLITSTTSLHWRIVIGRLGRLGHGEIQEWSKYLSRRNFLKLSKDVSDKCHQCMLNGDKHPSIYSACLTSMEPEGSFTILSDSVKFAFFGRSSNTAQQVQVKTPDDASCTHIYVFPTSSLIQTAAVGNFQNDNDDLLNGFSLAIGDQDDIPFDGINDLFASVPSPDGNPSHADDLVGPMKAPAGRLISTDMPEDIVLQQQPLALGYYVSTAPTGPLPDSFWVSCPHAQSRCPVFLRFALHLQVSTEEGPSIGAGDSNDNHHQLDSHKTADVLRYVMENYNALSWLTCDPVSKDRRSCLPIHYFVLTRLYHAIKELT